MSFFNGPTLFRIFVELLGSRMNFRLKDLIRNRGDLTGSRMNVLSQQNELSFEECVFDGQTL